jgi:catechol 2,3-dioxygenase-like lactoylglutathione lyase family enzyme
MTPELTFIGIVTSDLTGSVGFYRDLGLSIPPIVPGEDHLDATLPNGVTLAWDTVELIQRLDPTYQRPTGGHRIALAFNVGEPAEVDRLYAAMVAAGHRGTTAPWDAFWGQRYASLSDPDGNAVDVFASLPTS